MAQEFEQLEIDSPDKINNLDTLELVNWIDAAIRSGARAGSASNFESHEQDLVTQNGLLEHITHRFESHAGAPELWTPDATPRPQPVPSAPVVVRSENPTLQHMVNLWITLRTQLLFSESAARMNGYIKREAEASVRPLLEKMQNYLTESINDLGNPTHSWVPDVDDQSVGANEGNPPRR